MIRPLLLALWLVWSACGNTPKADQTAERQAGADTVVTILTTSDEGDEAPWWTKLGLPQPDTLIVPAETADLPGVEIMPTGSFHGDEIDENASKKAWLGLFCKEAGAFFLKKTSIVQKHSYDPVLDEDESQPGSGWLVKTPLKDSCYLLIQGLAGTNDGPLETVSDSFPRKIYPGANWTFALNGQTYTLNGEGAMKNAPEEGAVVVNYRLWLSSSLDGHSARQLLVAQPEFDDAMIELLWAGDLDRDGRPDFIFNLSNHYNAFEMGLFLSSRAAKGEFVRFVCRHISVGC